MNANVPEDISARMARLETSQSETQNQIKSLATTVEKMSVDFHASRRTSWQTVAAYLGLAITMVGMAGSILLLATKSSIAPVAQLATQQATVAERHDRRIEGLLTAVEKTNASLSTMDAATVQKFAEVETQFAWLSSATGMANAEQERLLKLLWRRAYGEELPPNGPWPQIGR